MKAVLLIAPILFCQVTLAQDSSESKEKWELNGYLKNMENLTFDHLSKQVTSGNLLHNRINIKWMPSATFTAVAQIRNRLFWGEEIKLTPSFSSLLKNENEKINLQVQWINSASVVLHTNTERLYVDYRTEKWNARVGRQRINWGVTTTWNPNDVFNSYNFLDFDYEERAGVDAAKLQYQFNDFGNVELGYSLTGNNKGDIAAARFSFNKWNYDFHILSGWVNKQASTGAVWAGSIKESGIKGELEYYFRSKHAIDRLNVVLEWDHMFKKGWYANFSTLYNSRGVDTVVNNFGSINLKLSPQNLMPTKWNLIATTSKEITPLLSANMSVLFTPGTNLLILLPSVRYNLATNLDVDIVGQSFFSELNSTFRGVSTRIFLRMKWSY